MNCSACAAHVRRAIEALPAVTSVTVDLAAATATVEHQGADPEAICAAVEEEGYDASLRA